MVGEVIEKIEVDRNIDIKFYCKSGKGYMMYHFQDGCETVEIEDINGDLQDLIGKKILKCEQSSSVDKSANSATWSFFKIATIDTDIVIRWYGESNGYYSEKVDFELFEDIPSWIRKGSKDENITIYK